MNKHYEEYLKYYEKKPEEESNRLMMTAVLVLDFKFRMDTNMFIKESYRLNINS